MNRKITLFFALILAMLLFSMCAQEEQEKRIPETTPSPSPTPEIKETEKPPRTPENEYKGEEVVCENCHINENRLYVPQADRVQGHINGLNFCVYCHAQGNDSVKAIGDLHHSKYRECMKCHTDFNLEKMDCGSCHGYPDPFSASNGNLLDIHMKRGVGCKSCHGDDFFRIHIQGKRFPEKFGVE